MFSLWWAILTLPLFVLSEPNTFANSHKASDRKRKKGTKIKRRSSPVTVILNVNNLMLDHINKALWLVLSWYTHGIKEKRWSDFCRHHFIKKSISELLYVAANPQPSFIRADTQSEQDYKDSSCWSLQWCSYWRIIFRLKQLHRFTTGNLSKQVDSP